jgi:hypothetical protein
MASSMEGAGAAAGPVPTLGEGASLLVYRAPVRQ